MPTYLVERYLPRMTEDGFSTVVAETRRLAADSGLTCTRSTLLVQDEIGMFVLEADSAEAVAAMLEQAGLSFERITDAIESPRPDTGGAR